MHPSRRSCLAMGLACVGALAAIPALAEEVAVEDRYKKMPWHLVDIWWNLGQDAGFESYSVDVTISDDVPDDVSLYLSPIGIAHLSGTPFYGGIQTRTDGASKADPKLKVLGRGLLLSMWNQRSTDAIRPADGGYFQSSGHEGDFVSVRRPYAWTRGKYTYRVTRMDRALVDGKPETWVGAFVYSHDKNENIFIGALRFKGENLVLDRQVASFVEIYGARRPVSDIPKFSVTFGNLQLNGAPVTHPRAEAVYPDGVPDVADTKLGADGLTVEVGKPVKRTDRRVTIISN